MAESSSSKPEASKDSEIVTCHNDKKSVEEHDDVGSTSTDSQIEVTSAKDEEESKEEVVTSKNDAGWTESYNNVSEPSQSDGTSQTPPLPLEELPPLPSEAPPLPSEAPPAEDDGWAPVWDQSAQAFYFFNRFTGATQWDNPRVPEVSQPGPPGVDTVAAQVPTEAPPSRPAGGYDPAIHGDYDPNAWYAQPAETPAETATAPDPAAIYAATGAFNRFTGKWQTADVNPENYNDENKSKRQMNAFFDVDAAANSHDGRSLKAERSGKKVSKQELKQFKEKRKAKKEEKRRAWLRD